jgi:hypothetical protein
VYDPIQAIQSGIIRYLPFLQSYLKDDRSRLFCSELVASAMVAATILPSSVIPSQITPRDLIKFDLYDAVELLKGKGLPRPLFSEEIKTKV